MGGARGIELSRVGKHGRKAGGLLGAEIRGGFSEVGAGSHFDAEDPVTPLGDIQIQFNDALFGQALLDPPGQDRLL